MNRLFEKLLPIMFVVIGIHAVSLRNERVVQNYVATEDFKTELKEISDADRPQILASASQPILLTESTTRRPAIPRLFHLWWSIFIQTLFQLRRQQAKTTEMTFSFKPNGSAISTTSVPYLSTENEAHNVNDIAAGLETISIDSPVFDLMPLE